MTEATAKGIATPVAHWLSTSLVPKEGEGAPKEGDGGYVWAMQIDNIYQMFASYKEFPAWPVLDAPPQDTSIHVVRAGLSPRWTPPVLSRLEECEVKSGGRTMTHLIPNSGHWVNVDAPDELMQIMAEHLPLKT